jgi:hypothetical protein
LPQVALKGDIGSSFADSGDLHSLALKTLQSNSGAAEKAIQRGVLHIEIEKTAELRDPSWTTGVVNMRPLVIGYIRSSSGGLLSSSRTTGVASLIGGEDAPVCYSWEGEDPEKRTLVFDLAGCDCTNGIMVFLEFWDENLASENDFIGCSELLLENMTIGDVQLGGGFIDTGGWYRSKVWVNPPPEAAEALGTKARKGSKTKQRVSQAFVGAMASESLGAVAGRSPRTSTTGRRRATRPSRIVAESAPVAKSEHPKCEEAESCNSCGVKFGFLNTRVRVRLTFWHA